MTSNGESNRPFKKKPKKRKKQIEADKLKAAIAEQTITKIKVKRVIKPTKQTTKTVLKRTAKQTIAIKQAAKRARQAAAVFQDFSLIDSAKPTEKRAAKRIKPDLEEQIKIKSPL